MTTKKTGITRPRPDGGVTRKAPGALTPPLFSLPSGSKIYLMWPRKIQAQVVIYRTFYVFAIDNINQGMNCPIFSILACVRKSVMNYFDQSVTQSDRNSYCAIKMGMNASSICCLSKLTSTFVLVLIECSRMFSSNVLFVLVLV